MWSKFNVHESVRLFYLNMIWLSINQKRFWMIIPLNDCNFFLV